MTEQIYDYVIVGGGLAGASAVEGIREVDKNGSILLIGRERHMPYNRPPLSKKLWFGQKKVEDIFVEDQNFYENNGVEMAIGMEATVLDSANRTITGSRERRFRYGKLLLATGGIPRTLDIPGASMDGICYYRYLDDYTNIRAEADAGKSAVIIGGGFIGSEMAAALNINKLEVTMVFPDRHLLQSVLPEGLGVAVQQDYINRGVNVIPEDTPASFSRQGGKFVTMTTKGREIVSDLVIVGIGIIPAVGLAELAGLKLENGIVVDDRLRTSDPNIYAAGDNTNFPYLSLGKQVRIEHWDNALSQGKQAGRNMAGADEPFTYMPYFFSDLFDFGFEAVGDVRTKLATFADWQKENDTGVIYYLENDRVRGVMLCNVWEKLDAAREIIKEGKTVSRDDLIGAIV